MQKMYVHRPFMRPKIRHPGIYEKTLIIYISCISRPFKGILRTAFLCRLSRGIRQKFHPCVFIGKSTRTDLKNNPYLTTA
jgi:hypothetical protein